MTQPLHELRERLLRAGVAPRHVRRYLNELNDHLADLRAEEQRSGRNPAEAESAALLRLGSNDDLAKAMLNHPHFQSFTARAPWATFGLAPLALLTAAYVAACLILWTGWQIFLPGTPSPFVQIHGLAVFYFGIGKSLYLGGPIFVGWVIALIAARQRIPAIWPTAGLLLTTVIGCLARVHATPPTHPGAPGHVHMGVSLWPSTRFSILYAFLILAFTATPYILWRLHNVKIRQG